MVTTGGDRPKERLMSLKIFLSHSSKYRDLALKVKLSLQTLEAQETLEIRFSDDMVGATDWREWIEENVRSSDVFLLLYPSASMEMGWCNYELGRFYDRKRPIICIKNTDITSPPPAFQPYQSYDANPVKLAKFLREMFYEGAFSNKVPINADIVDPSTQFFVRAQDVANVIATQFAEARVKEHFYERRLVFSLRYNGAGTLDLDKSTIEGNTEGLHLLGLSESSTTTWSFLKRSVGENGSWLTELESALPQGATGALPPALPPYRSASAGIHLPIVVKAETADGRPRQLVVIFVSAGIDRLLPLLGWTFPRGMPDDLKYLMQLIRLLFRARWEILEPRFQEAQFRSPDAERCAALALGVTNDYAAMEREMEQEMGSSLGKFFGAFDKDLRPEVSACTAEYMEIAKRLREVSAPSADALAGTLDALLRNNLRWLGLTTRQLELGIADLH